MTFIPCGACGDKPKGKLVWTAWVWWDAANERHAWSVRLCMDCFRKTVLQTALKADQGDTLTCPNCGMSTAGDLDGMYLTVAMPQAGKQQFELAYDPACAAMARAWVLETGTRLEPQQPVKGPGPFTELSPNDVWRSLGIVPRA